MYAECLRSGVCVCACMCECVYVCVYEEVFAGDVFAQVALYVRESEKVRG